MPDAAKPTLSEVLRACALDYRGDDAPVVRWYAEGNAAERLVALARQGGVSIESGQANELLLALKSVKVNTRIPRELYIAVARIYAYLLQRTKKAGS